MSRSSSANPSSTNSTNSANPPSTNSAKSSSYPKLGSESGSKSKARSWSSQYSRYFRTQDSTCSKSSSSPSQSCDEPGSSLAVRILLQDEDRPNPEWAKTFPEDSGFDLKYQKTQYPNDQWLSATSCLSQAEQVLLYNQYLLWVQAVETNQPVVIIYNRCYSVESDQMTAELVKAGQNMSNQDIVYYGKYLDRCDLYQYDRTVIVSSSAPMGQTKSCKLIPSNNNGGTVYKFPVYRTFSPGGLFAYLIFPSGARKLIREATICPDSAEEVANRAIEKGLVKALVYHPSIIRISDPHHEMFGYECREPEIGAENSTWGQWFWYIIIVIFLAIVVAAIIYFLATNISYSPDQRITTGYQYAPPLTNCQLTD